MASESSREIEAEIEATRARLYGTIDRIQSKLTVAGIVDEVMGSAGVPRYQNGHDFVLGLMRRHPVPVMIAAAGLGFLVYRMNRQRARAETIADVDYVEVPALNEGQARIYDPDLPTRHPTLDAIEGRRPDGAKA
ncbi:DUF3618 domain-containing protein [Enterovirga aerilata]|uniref:DUF3618 domain-containing protein n=1 Tax=Enterovirga aerilata TaxID=2730920 RepID=A0A849ICH0_9HYPH|nr:DUF3618 domain-containing protein [Enterovirga sp. DB1703]NNM73677.1 DUF3618 domain-containing protein [Enterovirga sp. DB1703]